MTLNNLGFLLRRPQVASPGGGSNPVIGQMRKLKPSKTVCLLRGIKLVGSNRTGLPTLITLPTSFKKIRRGRQSGFDFLIQSGVGL